MTIDTTSCAREPRSAPGVDLEALKSKQRATWASGDYAIIGTTLQIVGETLCEAADLCAGCRVLDVACGNGNAALAAARRFCRVTAVDYVPALLENGRARAAAERLPVEFIEGDAEALPFPTESFDAVLSTFGVMFSADQSRAARELVRVVRPGGTIALANWTPESFVGRVLGAVGKHLPAPAGVPSPVYWGSEDRLQELFAGVTKLAVARRTFTFRYESAQHFIDVFRAYYGPTHRAFAALDEPRRAVLAEDLRTLIESAKRHLSAPGLAERAGIAIPSEYLEVVIQR